MRTIRFPIAALMGAVVVVALGLAALRNASDLWAGATFLVTCGVLCLAIVGAVCRTGTERLVAGLRPVRLGLPGAGVLVVVRAADDGPARCDSSALAPTESRRRHGRRHGHDGWHGRHAERHAGRWFRRQCRPHARAAVFTDRALPPGPAAAPSGAFSRSSSSGVAGSTRRTASRNHNPRLDHAAAGGSCRRRSVRYWRLSLIVVAGLWASNRRRDSGPARRFSPPAGCWVSSFWAL